MSGPIELPSPADAAAVDAWVRKRLHERGAQNRIMLERTLPSEFAGGNAFRAIDASLIRLRNAGDVLLANNRFSLKAGVKP